MKLFDERKQSINTMLNSSLTILYGIALLTNTLLNGSISQTVGNWYELLAILFVFICISNACCRNAPQYIILIFSFIGMYIYMRLSRAQVADLGYFMNLPILFLFVGLGFFISFFATKGNSGFMKTSIVFIGGAIIFIIASFMNIYNLIVPALIVGISLIILTYTVIRHCYAFGQNKEQQIKDKLEVDKQISPEADVAPENSAEAIENIEVDKIEEQDSSPHKK